MKKVKICRIFGLVLMVAGCSVTSEYRRPTAITPKQWKNKMPAQDPVASAIAANWWKQFGSDELDRLIAEALNNNMDLTAAKERIRQFRALAKIAGAPLWPALNASGSFDYTDRPRSIRSTGTGGGSEVWQGGWNVAYEVDLWGGIRAGRDAAVAEADTARFNLEALRLVVMSDVAQAYFAILGLKERWQIANDNLKNIGEVLDIIVSRFEEGGASGLEVAQQQTERSTASAELAALEQQIAQSENALAVLLGRAPQQFRVGEISLQPILLPKPHPSHSAALLDRRPDIRGAEAQLMAAQANIGVARAAFYPRLQLSADNVFATAASSQPAGMAWLVTSSLMQPIFQGGRLEGELERTLARRTELLEVYRQTILTAYREVEDALALGSRSTLRRNELLQSVDSAKQAYELARDRYLAGATDYQTLLNVQRSLFNARDSEVQAHADVLSASVLLFKALGGGWSG